MQQASVQVGELFILRRHQLDQLFDALKRRGYCLVGPTVRDGAVIYDQIESSNDLPAGWTDEQQGGMYRLKKRADAALFGYTVGPHAWKKWLFPPALRLFRLRRAPNGFELDEQRTAGELEHPRYAFIGVRACELHAIAIQDRVFLQGAYVDSTYRQRREHLFILAVNCGQAGGTCFCVSMKTGPKVTDGFDLAMTELLQDGRHDFVVEVGTALGAAVLADVTQEAAGDEERAAAEQVVERTAQQMGRVLDTTDIKNLLYRNAEHPRWDDVARRCLTCANCTMVCPTCFCSTVEDVTDLTGQYAERWRRWDSCFTMDFSYIHGGSVRASSKARYRQWLMHKLATWIDQFGSSGCVGCGRCITWCPVGIDITEEVQAIRASEPARSQKDHGDT
ncbi:MAG: 4Fe-4S dicluster domain-containing protein [Acidobacteriota bacterium]|nr:4Fe-4S dicluster domain-containing protein [Blastocatellia bacterium]MDW8241399.1 4Fe-4S dicluster domain-containing protein [Acidobacteriota bacterium]